VDEGRKKLLKKVPTRTLLASIKRDMREALKKPAPPAKSKRK
jgi:hypothetical protein